jgi:hypothetical protein
MTREHCLIEEKGFVQVARRCAIRQHEAPNDMLWDILYDAKVWGRITVWKGLVNLAFGSLPANIRLNEIRQRLFLANQLGLTS